MNNSNKLSQLKKYINLRTISQEKSSRNKEGTKKIKIMDNYLEKCMDKYKANQKKDRNVKENNRDKKREIPLELYVEIKHIFRHIDVLKNYGFS